MLPKRLDFAIPHIPALIAAVTATAGVRLFPVHELYQELAPPAGHENTDRGVCALSTSLPRGRSAHFRAASVGGRVNLLMANGSPPSCGYLSIMSTTAQCFFLLSCPQYLT